MKKILIIFMLVFFLFSFDVKASDNLLRTDTKNEVMFIKDNEGKFLYSWSFGKEEFKKHEFEFDLGIEFTSPNKEDIDKLVDSDIKRKYISFNYHGDLPTTATIKVPVSDSFKEGNKLMLYYYNPDKTVIELVQSNIRVINGNVSFEIEHCSDYFLAKAIVENAEGTNNSGIIIVGMIVVIVGLVGYTLMRNK